MVALAPTMFMRKFGLSAVGALCTSHRHRPCVTRLRSIAANGWDKQYLPAYATSLWLRSYNAGVAVEVWHSCSSNSQGYDLYRLASRSCVRTFGTEAAQYSQAALAYGAIDLARLHHPERGQISWKLRRGDGDVLRCRQHNAQSTAILVPFMGALHCFRSLRTLIAQRIV